MVFGFLAFQGESFSLQYKENLFGLRDDNVFLMRSACAELRMMS